MTQNEPISAREALVQELLAAIEADWPVARGHGRSRAEPSFYGYWLVMDGDCAERVRKAAAALRESAAKGSPAFAVMDCPSPQEEQGSSSSREALVQELLAAIEANKTFATGTGHCPDVPIFDRHDSAAESSRPGWELVDGHSFKRVEQAAAALREHSR